ncbi:hypothetical protein F0P96_08820 [Hymenobacter busanensis]|uniref:Uncharacterized protein n=1 Tax=Hymenobacter busanensis TaxID=2607656 RepID=A0A7L5A346_9BACT|nr:hypothetical protein [Hymenobacter busanensis]KAA9333075.1 hypothetical protein F0P96_08820 [Hymenobacter busanensis]QHJ08250.1 hypothetical protein GUY19_13505 [Hymenobacter busanensis]
MTSKNLVSGLAAVALLALASCSSEPSDWRPDRKVSVDQVPPGTRSSDNFDLATDAPSQHKGGAIAEPVSSHMDVEQTTAPAAGKPEKPSAGGAMSADAVQAEGSKQGEAATKDAETQHDLSDGQREKNQN